MEKLRATVVLNEAGLKLIAIEAVHCHRSKTDLGYRLVAGIKPMAIIVCHRQSVYAMDTSAQPMALERLKREVPELEAMVDALRV